MYVLRIYYCLLNSVFTLELSRTKGCLPFSLVADLKAPSLARKFFCYNPTWSRLSCCVENVVLEVLQLDCSDPRSCCFGVPVLSLWSVKYLPAWKNQHQQKAGRALRFHNLVFLFFVLKSSYIQGRKLLSSLTIKFYVFILELVFINITWKIHQTLLIQASKKKWEDWFVTTFKSLHKT